MRILYVILYAFLSIGYVYAEAGPIIKNKEAATNAELINIYQAMKKEKVRVDNIIPAGSKMPFYQTSCPPGWTHLTADNDKILRVVSGVGGGNTATQTVTAGGVTLTYIDIIICQKD